MKDINWKVVGFVALALAGGVTLGALAVRPAYDKYAANKLTKKTSEKSKGKA